MEAAVTRRHRLRSVGHYVAFLKSLNGTQSLLRGREQLSPADDGPTNGYAPVIVLGYQLDLMTKQICNTCGELTFAWEHFTSTHFVLRP